MNITYFCNKNVQQFRCLEKESGQHGCIIGSKGDFEKWDKVCTPVIIPGRRRRRAAGDLDKADKEFCACKTDLCNDYEKKYGFGGRNADGEYDRSGALRNAALPLIVMTCTLGLTAASLN